MTPAPNSIWLTLFASTQRSIAAQKLGYAIVEISRARTKVEVRKLVPCLQCHVGKGRNHLRALRGYMGLLGFWEMAIATSALLDTAACLSILIGIPLGMFAARRPRFYGFIQPIMDFMQTMPAFVFKIPVIAFFCIGKPAALSQQ